MLKRLKKMLKNSHKVEAKPIDKAGTVPGAGILMKGNSVYSGHVHVSLPSQNASAPGKTSVLNPYYNNGNNISQGSFVSQGSVVDVYDKSELLPKNKNATGMAYVTENNTLYVWDGFDQKWLPAGELLEMARRPHKERDAKNNRRAAIAATKSKKQL